MTEKVKLPKDDVVFKNLFSSKENKELIKELLEAILERKINTIEVNKEVETSIMHVEEKYGRIDLQAIINNETIVIIEMQKEDRGDIDKRAIYYAGKVIGSSLERGEAYDQMKEVVVICILNYEMTERIHNRGSNSRKQIPKIYSNRRSKILLYRITKVQKRSKRTKKQTRRVVSIYRL